MNLIGLQTLLAKEVQRFLKVPGQTLAQPVVITSLYFIIFGFSIGSRVKMFQGVPYAQFVVPGLVMMGVIQNAFLNTASSMFVMKIQGTIVDVLVAPLGTGELLLAFITAAMVRGLLVGALTWAVAIAFTGFQVAHVGWVLLFALLVSASFALAGLIVAIWSQKFEQLNLVPTFVITPLTFLGGVFYDVSQLPAPWRHVARLNPVLYMVEGLRYGMLGVASTSVWVGLAITFGLCAACLALAAWMIETGYKLRG